MPGHNIVVIGTSSGGVETLSQLVGGLPPNFPGAVFIVLHVPAQNPSSLPAILSRAGPLPATHVKDQETIQLGRIYVAPPDFHMLVDTGLVCIRKGPAEHYSRPAIDPLFRSAAQSYGSRVVGVILSGALRDGSAGLCAIKAWGGTSVVQDPQDALFAPMPRHALNAAPVDYCLPLPAIAPLLVRLVGEPVTAATAALEPDRRAVTDRSAVKQGQTSQATQTALWGAIQALKQRAQVARRLARQVTLRASTADVFERQAKVAEDQARLILQIFLKKDSPLSQALGFHFFDQDNQPLRRCADGLQWEDAESALNVMSPPKTDDQCP